MGKKDVYNLTNPQKNIWNMEQYYSGTPINNICGYVIIKENANLDILSQAINKFIENNDSFRIRITLIDSTPFQYFVDNKKYEFEQIEFSDIEELSTYSKKEASTPFKILESQLFCFKIFKLANGFGGFIINSHHIISDAATYSMVGTEIMSNYIKIKNNEEIDNKQFSYIDYINSEKKYINSSKFEKDKIYWNSLFEEIPLPVTIPSMKNLENSIAAERLEVKLNKDLLIQLNEYCKLYKVSLYNFLIAIYSIYLGKINDSSNFSIGTPILNRSNFSEKHTSGMFISTSLLKVTTDNATTFNDFIQSVSKNCMSMLRHQKYDYQYILNDLRRKNQDITNLYDIVLSYQITKATDTSLSVPYESIWSMTPFISNSMNIHFHDNNNEGSLLINYDYKTCKYEKEDIINIHNRILFIIRQVIDNPDINIDDIQIATPKEKYEILNIFNQTSIDYDKKKTLIDIFEKQVKNSSNKIAVIFEDKKITYKELDQKSSSLANYLKDIGVNNTDIICIALNRSIELIISIFAVIKSGASYVLIDPEFPKERIDYIIENSESKYCILNNETANKINITNSLNIDKYDYSKHSINSITKKHINDNLCVIYTSGSTGNPKGVLLHKHGFINLINAFDKDMQISKYRKILGIATVSFDMFAVELFSAILWGNTLVLANEEEQKNPIKLSNLIKNNNVDFFITTPSRVELLLSKNCNNPLKTVKAFQLGGEKFTSNLYNKLRKSTNAKIYNGYGPTEITACCTNKHVNTPNITIGKPIANVQTFICDKNMNLMPSGVTGEICVAGVGVTNGYLNDKERTSKSFIHNPFGKGYLYKTGDLGRFINNGEIQYLGRLDNQIKLHGLRIELEEIENRINELSSINSCTVVKKGNSKSREYLCAYYTSNVKVSVSDIRNYLDTVLPKYMIPSFFIHLDKLPITSNGKIDKKRLPEPEYVNKNKELVLPRNEIDETLLDLYKKLLDIDSISIDDNFFELGGDSLSAINLCVQIQEKLNVEVFVKDIMENPSIIRLSDIIGKSKKSIVEQRISVIPKQEYYEASSSQKSIYFASKLAGDNSLIYNTPGGIILEGNIDTDKLENCINTLINRHESLRTYFELHDEVVVQKIIENYNFKLDKIENVDIQNIDDYFKEFVKPFDLSKAPLFRAKYISFSNGKAAFFIDMHHIICDGTSMSIFIDELCKLFNNEDLLNTKITYKDYSKYEKDLISSGALKNAEKYWTNQFKDEIPVLNLPIQKTRPAIRKYIGRKYYAQINSETAKKIEYVSNNLKITPYMVLLACYYILLYKYTSQNDIVIGTPVANRTIPQVSSVIGMFVNTLALRNKIDSKCSFEDFVNNIKDNLLESYKYQNYPFNELVNNLNIRRDTSRNPLFDTMFTYQNNGYLDISFNDIKTSYYIPDISIAKYDLSLEVSPVEEGISLSFEYSTDIFDEYFIGMLSTHYISIINKVLNNININISDIQVLTDSEKNQIINTFNNTHVDFKNDKTLINMFEEQVKKQPDNVAIVFENQELTYSELNTKSNSLANYMISLGVTNNDIICISLSRSIELIIAIYAVIKSGASYVLIDTSLPKERINYIVNDSKSKYCIISNETKDLINLTNKINIDTFNFTHNNSKNISVNNTTDSLCTIYTSGSTGNPKGVLLHKHGFVNLALAFDKELGLSNYTKSLSLAGVSFDMFSSDLFIATLMGKTLVLTNEKEQNDPIAISKLIKQHNIELLITTPSRIELLLLDECKNPLENVKTIILGGEVFHSNLYTKLKEATPAKIYNGYGPTETTACCTLKQILSEDNITIGKPIANVQAYICDSDMNLLPIGIVGEICIGGQGVSNGYINDKELTQKSFINNPYGRGLLYKTGDLGKFNINGEIEYIGRLDNQVKLHGLRIELEEIESIILKYPNITNVVVIKQTIDNRDLLSAYYTSNSNVTANKLKEYLGYYLPQYMVPSYYIALDSFPYTSSGKIDKKSLPISNEILTISQNQYIAPTNTLQKQLVTILEKLLNTKPIGINDNFFELGGDSLFAMNLNVELAKFSKNITYQDIFRYPTISELENKIRYNSNEPFFNKIENLSDKYVDILNSSKETIRAHNYHPKNILITGTTGFLGIHILEEFIKHEKGNIYCIVRDGKDITAKAKLHKKLNYYFGDKYDNLIDNRIFVITGNITEPGFGLKQEELLNLANSIDTVIHSAANVSHFGNYNQFYTTNVVSVKYILDFCKSFNLKLYHISTLSVADTMLDISYPSNNKKNKTVSFDESCLYVGQPLDNIYARTKFEAETLLLDSICEGLDAYILRMGNLMPRFRDGIFQENILSNEFVNKVLSFMKLKIFPDYLLNLNLNFTPIDQASKAIYKLITHPNNTNRIFHLCNNTIIKAEKLLKIMKKLDCNIDILPEKKFQNRINNILEKNLNKDATKNIINDFNNDLHLEYKSDIIIKSDITNKYLKKRFFKWKKINNNYLIRFVNLLKKEL